MCWGRIQMDYVPTARVPTPVGIDDAIDIGIAFYHACALRRTGSIVCWGSGPRNDTLRYTMQPTPIRGIDSAVSIAIGEFIGCALLSNRTVSCWGPTHYFDALNGPFQVVDRP